MCVRACVRVCVCIHAVQKNTIVLTTVCPRIGRSNGFWTVSPADLLLIPPIHHEIAAELFVCGREFLIGILVFF